ncbi:MAG: preprotein translocase subunit Sec61beta [archaeon]
MKGIETTPVRGPVSSAGLMSMFSVSGGGPKIKPMVLVGICVAFIVIEIVLNVIA